MVTTIDRQEIEQELLVFIRNQDILTTTERSVTTATENFTSDGTDYVTVANSNIKNVRTVTVNSSTQTFGTHYITDYEGTNIGRVSFVNGLNNNDVVAVQYDYGTDKIFTDYPRADLELSSYPRISLGVTSIRSNPFAIGGNAWISDILFSVTCFASGAQQNLKVKNLSDSIRNKLANNQKNFYYFDDIRPSIEGPIIHDPNRHDKIEQITHDYIIANEVEL